MKDQPKPIVEKAKVHVNGALHDCEILGTIDKNWIAVKLYGQDVRVRPEQIRERNR